MTYHFCISQSGAWRLGGSALRTALGTRNSELSALEYGCAPRHRRIKLRSPMSYDCWAVPTQSEARGAGGPDTRLRWRLCAGLQPSIRPN
jgi:hypothetical protein